MRHLLARNGLTGCESKRLATCDHPDARASNIKRGESDWLATVSTLSGSSAKRSWLRFTAAQDISVWLESGAEAAQAPLQGSQVVYRVPPEVIFTARNGSACCPLKPTDQGVTADV